MMILGFTQMLESYSMDRFRQRCHGCGCDLEEQLDHMPFNQLMFDLGHILRLKAIEILYLIKQKLESCSMGQFLLRYHGYEYGLVELLNRKPSNR